MFTANVQSEAATMTTVGYRSDLQAAHGTLPYGKAADAALHLVCLWSVVGLTLSGVFVAMGLGDGIAQALMVAG